MTRIERNRDTYICINAKGKRSYYNITTGEKVGYNGKALKQLSVTLAPFANIQPDTPQKEFIDRLISLGMLSPNNLHGDKYNFWGREYAEKCSQLMEKSEWKKVLSILSKMEDREYRSFESLIGALYSLNAIEKTALPEFKNIDFDYLVKRDSWRTDMFIKCCMPNWSKKALVKWMKQVDNGFEDIVKAQYTLYEHDELTQITSAFYARIETLNAMVRWKTEFSELSYDEKKSIFKNHEQWQKDIKILKNKKASELFAKTQTAKDYSFTSDNYSVTVPTSYEDCQKISSVFHNCVAHYYWNTYLSTGERIVVVVNKNGKPAVCCSFNARTLKIVDYLAPYNYSVQDEDDKNFKALYQNYLISLK